MKRRHKSADINMIPYIDVLLVLLLIFMLGTAGHIESLQMSLPEVASSSHPVSRLKTIQIGQTELVEIEGSPLGVIADLTDEHFAFLKHDDQIVIQADKLMSYDALMRLMALLQKRDLKNIELAYVAK